MKSFLKEVAGEIALKFSNFKDVVLILPGKRPAVFLKNELLSLNTVTTYAPEFYSIEAFVEKLSGLTPVGDLQLLFELYEVYKKETPPGDTESFQHFSRWAKILLQDFNEIDQYLVDYNQLFAYLSSVKEINHWYVQKEKTELQKNYIRFWNSLKRYYLHFRKRLLEKQIAYQGLLYSEAYNNAKKYLEEHPEKHHIFIGFNALNSAEENLIQEFLNSGNNHILWDIDETFLADNEHDAGLFIRSYKKEWHYFKDHDFKIVSDHFKTPKNIQITGIPKTVGQAKYAGKLIEDIHRKTGNLERTAVILGNEQLLTPLLNALPSAIGPVNITYGIPLYQVPVASFFGALFHLMENTKNAGWYYKNVLHILSHALTRKLLSHKGQDYAERIIEKMRRENIVFVSQTYIKALVHESLHEICDHIFTDVGQRHVNTVIKKCISLIHQLRTRHNDNDMYLEYLYKFHELFNRILYLNTTYGSISDMASLKRVYRELLRGETVNFRGEPLKGLQIMGMLESRNLDFENVIITGVNEGILPSGKKQVSFLPFDVKMAFNLPAYKEKDAIYTYHFYRLLQRAKNIYLLYNTEPDALEGGEKSRFLLQLTTRKQPLHHVEEIIASPEISQASKKSVRIKKNPDVITRLKTIASAGFSPTSLSSYIRNPVDFYYNAVLNIKAEDAIEETITAKALGIIIHGTLEDLYKPLEGKWLRETDIVQMRKTMHPLISRHFARVYREEQWRTGKNLIGFNIVARYIQHFLTLELGRLKQGRSVKIMHIEKNLETTVDIPGSAPGAVTLKGTIDRVEEVDGIITVTDYKTGKAVQADLEIPTEEAIVNDYRYHKAFQLLSYAYLYTKNYAPENPVEAAVLSFKNLKSGYLKFGKKDGNGRNAEKTAPIDREMLTAYENNLRALVLEIFDPQIPFTEKGTDA
ncbi:MAG: PD-(D/E)XK nuclease family protein [Sinomicrobium sp.]|nr:PD-(D/E)XK nuclease family protein [Sinomicrobium sp.]